MSEDEQRMKILKDMAKQDFIRVVRCADCIHCQKTAVTWCMYHDTSVTDKGYCSWGSRKKEG